MGMVGIAVVKGGRGNFFLLQIYQFDGIAKPVYIFILNHGHSRYFFEMFLHRSYG